MTTSGLDEVVSRVVARLEERGIEHRLIGAMALAAHGVARSTSDIDLLVTDVAVLDTSFWGGVAPDGFLLEVRRGDPTDPLLGVVRVEEDADPDDWEASAGGLDVVVLPRRSWTAGRTGRWWSREWTPGWSSCRGAASSSGGACASDRVAACPLPRTPAGAPPSPAPGAARRRTWRSEVPIALA